MITLQTAETLSPNDQRLIEEAIRRLDAARPQAKGSQDLYGALADQVRRGRRDLFTLVRADRRLLDGL